MNARRLLTVLFLVVAALLVTLPNEACAQPNDSPFHPEFPPRSGDQLSPPAVAKPIYECAEAVHVAGFIPHARVEVFANGTELIGKDEPPFGFTDVPIKLTRPLEFGETVSATQTIGGLTSSQSIHPVKVEHRPTFPTGLPMPTVHPTLYECGRVVPVGDMLESVRVKVFDEAVTVIGNEAVAGKWQPIWTAPLVKDRGVTAQLFACEHDPMMTVIGPPSTPAVKVQPMPSPMPSPIVLKNEQIVGNDAATVRGLLVGARVVVLDRGAVVGEGYATAADNWVPLAKPIDSASMIQAFQELCGVASPPSPAVPPEGKLEAPIVLDPICAGQPYAVIRNTTVNATVIVFRNGGVAGYTGAGPGDVIFGLGGGAKFNAGDEIVARQFMGPTLGPSSTPPVTVKGRLETSGLEIADGEPFFSAESGEQQIDGPVFPRGRKPGPLFLIRSCCNEKVHLTIEREGGGVVAEPPLTEIFPGYYSARWDWTSPLGWPVPVGLPVGRYFAVATTSCGEQPAKKPFYVIFNPADVGGPQRFTYDETGIWFGTGPNQTIAYLYHLHPDDKRVFEIARKAAQGTVDAADAAQRIVDAEEGLFAYDLGYHGNDVIHMLEDESEAQCADDANVLTSLLRSMGIPAHPATADAALETGAANWTFDTWTEFLATWGGPPEWRIFHPHQYETMSAETRSVFSNRGVATKGFNDIVVMADVNWDWGQAGDGSPDVSFGRQSCGEPEQTLSKAGWIREICEEGYWSPNHWTCPRTGMNASGLVADFEPARDRLEWGGRLGGTFRLENLTDSDFRDEVVIEVVADRPESKRFPDEVLSSARVPAELRARGERVERLDLDLPKTNPAGTILYLRARSRETTIAAVPLELRPRVGVRIEGPRRLTEGETAHLRVTVEGTDKGELADVRLAFRGPVNEKSREAAPRRIEVLRGKEISFDLELTASSGLDPIVVDVESAEGGSVRATFPIDVEPEKAFAQPAPSFRPRP